MLLMFPQVPTWMLVQEVIPPGKLKDYIAFARSTCHPQLQEDAAAKLVGNYLEMRSVGGSRKVRPTHISWGVSLACACLEGAAGGCIVRQDVAHSGSDTEMMGGGG